MTTTPTCDRRLWATEVVDTLRQLTERQATVLRLIYGEHLTDHQAAARMGIAVAQARAAAATGLRDLGDLLLR